MKNNKKVKKSKVSKDKKSKPKKSFDGKMILRVNATSLAFAILSFIILVAFTVVTA
ncbi:MAG: hypothetical protein K2M43_01125 [Mycoplasmoidaceae bacterium]|nr:hypothetical protein [Mycoplasmoidaceae bacterium]